MVWACWARASLLCGFLHAFPPVAQPKKQLLHACISFIVWHTNCGSNLINLVEGMLLGVDWGQISELRRTKAKATKDKYVFDRSTLCHVYHMQFLSAAPFKTPTPRHRSTLFHLVP